MPALTHDIAGAAAPSTTLRVVPLPRCAVEDARTPVDGRPYGNAIHATAVAIGRLGLMILGASGAGKSRLAAALIDASTSRRPISLIGDDRILLARRGADLVARPHPRIAGFIERRGLGIVACSFIAAAVVRGVIRLDREATVSGSTTLAIAPGQNFPGLPLVTIDRTWPVCDQRDAVLGWWRDACTTPAAKSTARTRGGGKV